MAPAAPPAPAAQTDAAQPDAAQPDAAPTGQVRPGSPGTPARALLRLAGRATVAGVWLSLLAIAVLTAVRLLGVERGPFVQLIAFTPYVALAGLLPMAVAVVLRRWFAVAVAVLLTLVLAGCVLPRATSDGAGVARTATGPALRVMTSNMLEGGASATGIVRTVDAERVDLLALQEYAPVSQRALAAAGLENLLPYRVAFPEPGVGGSALYSRYPLSDGALLRHRVSQFGQASATLTVPGAAPVRVESVHPCAPASSTMIGFWRSDFAELQRATPSGTVRVLLGDFNATLDHGMLRDLIDSGYRDAADVTGDGLVPSWPYDGRFVPWVTIDHVLADRRIGVRSTTVHRIANTDHRAVVAELVLPR